MLHSERAATTGETDPVAPPAASDGQRVSSLGGEPLAFARGLVIAAPIAFALWAALGLLLFRLWPAV
jgi:hypothetical protein